MSAIVWPVRFLGELAEELALQCFVVVLAQLAQRLGRRDDDKVVNAVVQDLLVKPSGGGGGETVFLEAAVVGVGGAAGMASTRTFVVAADRGLGQRGELGVRLVAGVAEQVELGAVGDGDGNVLGIARNPPLGGLVSCQPNGGGGPGLHVPGKRRRGTGV